MFLDLSAKQTLKQTILFFHDPDPHRIKWKFNFKNWFKICFERYPLDLNLINNVEDIVDFQDNVFNSYTLQHYEY